MNNETLLVALSNQKGGNLLSLTPIITDRMSYRVDTADAEFFRTLIYDEISNAVGILATVAKCR